MTVQDESAAAGSATSTHGVILTDAAAAKAKSLLEQEGRDDLALRIAVQPGGCAGLRYNLFFDDRSLDGDLTADFGGVTLTVDATGSCACGDSFN
jgi:iron-sulfur cluster assembly accessory protein